MHRMRQAGLQALTVLAVGLVILTEAAPSFAQKFAQKSAQKSAQFRPPNRGMPGRREGGGTRGGCPLQQPGLTALMPQSNLGATVAAQPRLFWYIPQNSVAGAEFVLLDANNSEIYKTQVAVPSAAGIVSLALPQDRTLVAGQPYRWYFSLICDPLDRSADTFTSGWVERVEPTAEFSEALAVAAAADLPRLYAQAGFWYDALASLADLRQSQPENPTWMAAWQTLLQTVGLEQLANQPILSVDLATPQPSLMQPASVQ
ncbi:MAG: DUF928 domain-containing protein [Pegethrix bostrychoides GSE-TBD4-15B]|uniref:DUF928 domain-containing protein n=1 Tax=Pegethrix bostrychoides GSE-TBD4-15B TaxID=2839662 RepID=A0A951P7B3_9CYAN|nr:DUF928 domain-containing protein [Pegethrix bostrychoides GSE-TBD4-15B]